MKSNKKHDDSPKIVVMNITSTSIPNSIKNMIHAVRVGTNAASVAENLKKGDICIIRQVSRERRYSNGVIGIWYYYDKKDVEGKTESMWTPSTGWKYKLNMKPLVKLFSELFFEEFSGIVAGQTLNKNSLKIDGLLLTDVQEEVEGAITINFRNPDLPKRYLKAIIEEKNVECDIEVDYENKESKKIKINVYEFLSDLIGEISHIKPNRGEISRKTPIQASTGRKAHGQKRPTVVENIEIDETQNIDLNKAGIGFCPTCGTILRPKTAISGILVYFCRQCNKAYKIKPK